MDAPGFHVSFNRQTNAIVFLRSADLYAFNIIVGLEQPEDPLDMKLVRAFQARVASAFVRHRGLIMLKDESLLINELVAFTAELLNRHDPAVAASVLHHILTAKFNVEFDAPSIAEAVDKLTSRDPGELRILIRRILSKSSFPKFHWWNRFVPA